MPFCQEVNGNNAWNDKFIPDSISEKDFWTVVVQAKWNDINGGPDYASLEKAKANYLKVATQVELAKKGIWLKAKKLNSEISSLRARVRSFYKQYNVSKRDDDSDLWS